MLSKSKKMVIFLFAAVVLSASIFFYELVLKKRSEEAQKASQHLLSFKSEDINYMVLENNLPEGGGQRFVLQKNQGFWYLMEPIQDKADQNNIEYIVSSVLGQNSKKLNIDNNNLSEYKMEIPAATWIIKTAKGESVKILVSAENNFEGYPFIQVANSPNINLGGLFWKSSVNEATTYFRHKKLVRSDIELVDRIRVTSLSHQFELVKKGLWTISEHPDISLDQIKIKTFIMKFFDLDVQDYISDGEPSQAVLKERGLDKNFVQVDVQTGPETWSAKFQMDSKTGQLFGLTDRPTQLVKLDVLKWEMLANLSYDQFRDRSSVFKFNPDEVQKFYVKTTHGELEIQRQGHWVVNKSTFPEYNTESPINSDLVNDYLRAFSQQELNYFLEKSDYAKLTGNNMIILKTAGDQLLMQLNWGPQMKKKIFGFEQIFYLARTHQDPMVFGLAPESIDKLLDFKFIKKELDQ